MCIGSLGAKPEAITLLHLLLVEYIQVQCAHAHGNAVIKHADFHVRDTKLNFTACSVQRVVFLSFVVAIVLIYSSENRKCCGAPLPITIYNVLGARRLVRLLLFVLRAFRLRELLDFVDFDTSQ